MSAEPFTASGRTDSASRLVRDGRPEDTDAVGEILREAKLPFFTASAERGQSQPAIGEARTLVCDLRAEIVAVLQWRAVGQETEILVMAVPRAERRRGNAGFLLANFLRLAAASGAEQVFLEVRESNLPAIALYEKFGFIITGRRPNYYHNPDEAAVLMKSTLSS